VFACELANFQVQLLQPAAINGRRFEFVYHTLNGQQGDSPW
jgi:hypothetical protein